MSTHEEFSSRWGLILTGLGMAVGTGNLWRFPRIVAQNGGAAFLIPWGIFLFVWSLPLMIAEFALGRGVRRGVVGAFTTLVGRRFAWMGGFIAVTTVMILFYYSVITGWALKYVGPYRDRRPAGDCTEGILDRLQRIGLAAHRLPSTVGGARSRDHPAGCRLRYRTGQPPS